MLTKHFAVIFRPISKTIKYSITDATDEFHPEVCGNSDIDRGRNYLLVLCRKSHTMKRENSPNIKDWHAIGMCREHCGGKLCYNGGTLDINTCTCSCPSLYVGNQCQTLQCTNTEKSWCRTHYTAANCSQFSNFPIDCHMMCGVCPYPCDGKQCKNGGTLDLNTCQCSCVSPYAGDTCEDTNCPGTQQWWCEKYYTVDDCTRYSNFPSDCNIMCGVCPRPCDGKTCLNDGTLDTTTCECSCVTPYVGSTCENKDCSVGQKSWCVGQNVANCAKYSNWPSDCNILCGVCP